MISNHPLLLFSCFVKRGFEPVIMYTFRDKILRDKIYISQDFNHEVEENGGVDEDEVEN